MSRVEGDEALLCQRDQDAEAALVITSAEGGKLNTSPSVPCEREVPEAAETTEFNRRKIDDSPWAAAADARKLEDFRFMAERQANASARRAARSARRKQVLSDEVRRVVVSLHEAGREPTLREVVSRLTTPGSMRERIARDVLAQIRLELDPVRR